MQSTALTPLGALTDDERCSLREGQHLASLPAAPVAVPDLRGWACPTCAVGLCPPQPDLAQVRRRYATPTIRFPCAGPGRHESCVVAFGGGFPPSLVPPKAGEHAMARELQGPTTAPAWTGE